MGSAVISNNIKLLTFTLLWYVVTGLVRPTASSVVISLFGSENSVNHFTRARPCEISVSWNSDELPSYKLWMIAFYSKLLFAVGEIGLSVTWYNFKTLSETLQFTGMHIFQNESIVSW